jgi:UDPglucose--hexose-1-phosphate uridylyltransferase
LNVEIVSPWRSAGTARFIAAAEVACEEYFNPVIPEVLAEQLRSIG